MLKNVAIKALWLFRWKICDAFHRHYWVKYAAKGHRAPAERDNGNYDRGKCFARCGKCGIIEEWNWQSSPGSRPEVVVVYRGFRLPSCGIYNPTRDYYWAANAMHEAELNPYGILFSYPCEMRDLWLRTDFSID